MTDPTTDPPTHQRPTDTTGADLAAPGTVDPHVLGALLHRHGWHPHGNPTGPCTRWTPPTPGTTPTSLLIPTSRTYPDADDLLTDALTALTRSTTPSAHDILTGLTTPSDEIRWTRHTTAPAPPADATPWTGHDHLRTAARHLLLAAALAVHRHARRHGTRNRRQAAHLLEPVLIGTAPGARRLTAFVPVDTGRPLTERLHHALAATRDAVDYQRATGRPDAFDTAVAAGVSHELAQALVTLVHGTEGATVTLAWAPATGAPTGCAARPEPVEFTPGDLPALRQAAARYLRDEPSVPVRVTGTVVRLRRAGPRGPGKVRIRVLTGADVPYIRVTLPEDAYRTAAHAHLAGLPVRVSGRLESRGGFRRLTGAHGLEPVQVDEAERDRLMKTYEED